MNEWDRWTARRATVSSLFCWDNGRALALTLSLAADTPAASSRTALRAAAPLNDVRIVNR